MIELDLVDHQLILSLVFLVSIFVVLILRSYEEHRNIKSNFQPSRKIEVEVKRGRGKKMSYDRSHAQAIRFNIPSGSFYM